MTAALRPMNLGEILDRTFQIYRSRFLVFVWIASIPALAMSALQVTNVVWWHVDPQPWQRPVLFGLSSPRLLYLAVLYQVNLLFCMAAWPLFADLVSKEYRVESAPAPRAVTPRMRGRWRGYIWLVLTTWGTVLLLPELSLMALLIGMFLLENAILKGDSRPFDEFGPVMFFLTTGLGWAVSLWLMTRLCCSSAAWRVEDLAAGKALKRSWRLTKGTTWRVLFAWLLPVILHLAFSAVLGLLLMRMRSSCFEGTLYLRLKAFLVLGGDGWCAPIAIVEGTRAFANMLISTVLGPIFPIAITLIYYDQRIRKEGYDIERMIDAAGLNAAAGPVAALAGDSMPHDEDSMDTEVQPG